APRDRAARVAPCGGRAHCGRVAGRAVRPAHRGDGLFGALLTAVIARSGAVGMALSMLFPSTPEIYRRYGYQVVARAQSLIVPLVDLQRIPAVPGRRLVPVTAEAMPRLRRLHQELTDGDTAM